MVSISPATPAEGTAIPEPEQGLAGTNWQLIELGDVGAADQNVTNKSNNIWPHWARPIALQ